MYCKYCNVRLNRSRDFRGAASFTTILMKCIVMCIIYILQWLNKEQNIA